ncbi:MAG: orotate phosphoribosyltransferase [Saprospiraceae bacterium]
MKQAAKIASELLRIEAVRLRPDDPFTWASGIKSPIYTDNRVALAYPSVRDQIRDGLAEMTQQYDNIDAVVGVATAGIPHAALVGDKLGIPMAYVRSSAKSHGRQNRIEGRLNAGDRVIVIEDLISTGGSSLEAVEALREAGIVVVATLAIFTYGFDAAAARFAEANCPMQTLSDYPTLIEVAKENGSVNDAQLSALSEWRTATSLQLAK